VLQNRVAFFVKQSALGLPCGANVEQASVGAPACPGCVTSASFDLSFRGSREEPGDPMRRSFAKFLFGAFALGASLLGAKTASAAECGWLVAGGDLQCKLVVSGCSVECTPVSFTAQCGATCEGNCNVTVDASCEGSCESSCMGHCTPGHIDCEGDCETSCGTECTTYCNAHPTETACVTDCHSNCATSCQSHCAITPASCEESCQASCQGSCNAHVDASCQARCQGGCTSMLTGGCEDDCDGLNGALFCNGQYVELGDFTSCVAEFAPSLALDLTCNGAGCQGVGSATCSTTQASDEPVSFAAIGALAFGVGLIATRRRNKKQA
jgi:hypothetical protein